MLKSLKMNTAKILHVKYWFIAIKLIFLGVRGGIKF